MKKVLLASVLLLAQALGTFAETPGPEADQKELELRKVADQLHYREGVITLKDGLAQIKLSPEYRFLDGKDCGVLLTTLWHNPPGSSPLGAIVPSGFDPLEPGDASWAVIMTYEEDGHVKDDEASKLDYNKLLTQMQEATSEQNEERRKQGYPTVQLVGWATPPHYDAQTHKLYWAKDLRFEGTNEDTLNYSIRILGRRGVLNLNAVAEMSQLQTVQSATPTILKMVEFNEGNRYVDFNPSTDKVATYGIVALIAGGVLAKAGFFKLLLGFFKPILALLIAAKKAVIVGVVAIAGAAKRFFGKLTGKRDTSA